LSLYTQDLGFVEDEEHVFLVLAAYSGDRDR